MNADDIETEYDAYEYVSENEDEAVYAQADDGGFTVYLHMDGEEFTASVEHALFGIIDSETVLGTEGEEASKEKSLREDFDSVEVVSADDVPLA